MRSEMAAPLVKVFPVPTAAPTCLQHWAVEVAAMGPVVLNETIGMVIQEAGRAYEYLQAWETTAQRLARAKHLQNRVNALVSLLAKADVSDELAPDLRDW